MKFKTKLKILKKIFNKSKIKKKIQPDNFEKNVQTENFGVIFKNLKILETFLKKFDKTKIS